jgi:hypothetical protein
MTIRAKYQGQCRKCGGEIKVGEEIEWEKARGACHLKCAKTAEPVYNSPPPVDSAGNVDPAEEARKYGRVAVAGASPKFFSRQIAGKGDRCIANGTVILAGGGKRYLAISHSRPRYFSREDLEDFDMFEREPGLWYDWQGIEVEPTEAEKEADANLQAERDAKERAKQEAAEKQRAEKAALAEQAKMLVAGLRQTICGPAEYQTGERVLVNCDGRGNGSVYYRLMVDGETVIREESSRFDDSRIYHYAPERLVREWARRWAAEHGLTPEKARKWLAKYDGCHGTSDYKIVAEG